MTGKYEFVDMQATGMDAIATAFANQVAYCLNAGAPVTARVCAAVAQLLERGDRGPLLDRIRGWQGAPLPDALPLRVAGALHGLHLSGRGACAGRTLCRGAGHRRRGDHRGGHRRA